MTSPDDKPNQELVDGVLAREPYDYEYTAQNREVEIERARKYARLIALETLSALARSHERPTVLVVDDDQSIVSAALVRLAEEEVARSSTAPLTDEKINSLAAYAIHGGTEAHAQYAIRRALELSAQSATEPKLVQVGWYSVDERLPRDPIKVCVAHFKAKLREYGVGEWWPSNGQSPGVWVSDLGHKPTHWTPLPSAPTDGSGA